MEQPINKISLSALLPLELSGLRLDQALAKLFPAYSRARIQQWIQNEQVTVDGKLLRCKDRVCIQQHIQITAELPVTEASWQPQAIKLDILFADADLFVVNKPAGLVVHPATGNPDQTLVNALLYLAPEMAILPRAGIVHRLDKDTSGVMVVARSLEAHNKLVAQIQSRQVKREYLAITSGLVIAGGTIDAPVGRHPTLRTRMAVTHAGKHAVTHYRLIERFRAHSYISVLLETGRTHQIRVHMAHLGYPLVGDPVYGGRLKIPMQCSDPLKQVLTHFKRQALHAQRLTLTHPISGEQMSWQAPIPDDFYDLLYCLRQDFKQNS